MSSLAHGRHHHMMDRRSVGTNVPTIDQLVN
jgi:hypothetical protein